MGAGSGVRVLHLDTGKAFRGGQRQVLLLHRELVRRGWQSGVATPARSELARRCAAEGLPVLELASRRGWDPRVLRAVVAAARTAPVIHAHDPHAAGLAAAARRLGAGAAIVCHRRVAFPLRGRAGRAKYRGVDHWIAVTGEIRDQLRGWGVAAERCTVVPSAIDVRALRREGSARFPEEVRAELGLPAAGPLVVACGAVEPGKGVDVLIEAMPVVRGRFPDVLCAVAGDGRERSRLSGLVRDLGLAGVVWLLGPLPEVAGLMAAADVCVVPSRDREGSAAALKEPWALDRPLVASDLPSIREVVGEAACLAAPGDPAALATAILGVLHDSGLRARLLARGRERLEAFRPEAMVEGTVEVYDRLLQGLSGSR